MADPRPQFDRSDVRRSSNEHAQLLESLSDVGVALSGSFDIQAILRTTHEAAARIAGTAGVDVVYLGCEAINSRPRWYPAEPTPLNLDAEARDDVFAQIATRAGELPVVWVAGRQCYPLSYQEEHLGLLFLANASAHGIDASRLLSILTLQAATALRNIHLTQERIHFERLSAVGRMIGSIVHDFRGPLTALRGYAGMLASFDLDEDERKSYGRYVTEECDRLNRMVSELLEFTRGGSFQLEPEWIPLYGFLHDLGERCRSQFGAGGIRVEVSVPQATRIYIDRERMERALWNVLTNAAQAMPKGGTLRLHGAPTLENLVIAVEDDGAGIPEDVRHRIFEPFFSFGKAEGIGLGMMIARKITEAHDGQLGVESEKGVGTTMRFTLPLERVQSTRPEHATRTSTKV